MQNKSKRFITKSNITVYVVRILINGNILSCFGYYVWKIGELAISKNSFDKYNNSSVNMFHSFKTKEDAVEYMSTVRNFKMFSLHSSITIQVFKAKIPSHTFAYTGIQGADNDKTLPIYGSRKLILVSKLRGDKYRIVSNPLSFIVLAA